MSSPDVAVAGVSLRPMVRSDISEVAAIEAEVSPEPWSVELFDGEFDVVSATRHWVVAEIDNVIVGFGGMMFVSAAPGAGGEGHLMNVAVAPAHRRKGIAAAICGSVFRHAASLDIDALTLEVRLSNAGAIELYRGLGFAPVGTRKQYYTNPDGSKEDGLIMWLHDNLERSAATEWAAGSDA